MKIVIDVNISFMWHYYIEVPILLGWFWLSTERERERGWGNSRPVKECIRFMIAYRMFTEQRELVSIFR
jgi:hypothetical protein